MSKELIKRVSYDILIKNCHIIDGAGNPWFEADVGIKEDKIKKLGLIVNVDAGIVIKADGLVLSPGFIDIHSHSDFTLLINPLAESKIRQGVTTEVIGNCGVSLAPIKRDSFNLFKKWEILKDIGMTFLSDARVKWDWFSMKEYLKKLEIKGVGVNIVSLVGHGTLRINVLGFDNRAPTRNEINEMKELLTEALEDGARGMSSGLVYPPGSYAKTNELVELCKVLSKYNGIYSSHIRSEGDLLIEAVAEAIQIGKKSDIPIQISHHKASGRKNWGKVKETLEFIESARKEGVDITCDVYPYIAGESGLHSRLPSWIFEGGFEKLIQRLRVKRIRNRLKKEMMEKTPDWNNIMVLYCKRKANKNLEGKTIGEITKMKRKDPFDIVFDLIAEEGGAVKVLGFGMCEEDVCRVLRHPSAMIASDASAMAPYGILGDRKTHPRSYGTFMRVLGKYVREDKVLSLQEAIRKMTSLPAQKLGLWNRGLIREGMKADIIVFNPNEVIDDATFKEPNRYAKGIKYVLVNGKMVLKEGESTGYLSGEVIRTRAWLAKT